MATLAADRIGDDGGHRFFLWSAVAMAATVVTAFSVQLAMGRSTFASPPLVHAHALVFMGWVGIYVLQNVFVARQSMTLHRRLGWIGAGWMVAMVVLGYAVTVAMVRRGQVPFFFQPLQFMVFDPLSVFTFAGLTTAAIVMRRKTQWHRRLHFCGMALLLGPAFGRLLPLPLIAPWAYEATVVAVLIFPVIGVVLERRRAGHVHPAWRWGIGTILTSALVVEAITYSPLGLTLYRSVTAGSPGADVPPLAFPPPPQGPLITGRSASI